MEVINPRVGALRRGATADPEGFWAEVSQKVPWRRPWEAVFGWEPDFVSMLPKARSGKIMRRVLKAVTLGKDPGDISTIEDDGSVAEAREAWESIREELGVPAGGL